MESSALNAAHEKIRRAEALTREGRFAEAAECHEKVSSLLNEVHSHIATNLIDKRSLGNSKDKLIPLVPSIHTRMTLESLVLQRDYHRRQSEVVRMKQVQFDEYKNTLETQRRNLLNKFIPKLPEKESTSIANEKYEGGSLKQAIFRTIEEQDSLLNLMFVSDEDAFKNPKDTSTIIGELHTINNHLRTLVETLLCHLETKENEVRALTERLQIATSNSDSAAPTNDNHSKRLAPLPPLTPLEMPLFDFNSS